jgi:hypothetical protein
MIYDINLLVFIKQRKVCTDLHLIYFGFKALSICHYAVKIIKINMNNIEENIA